MQPVNEERYEDPDSAFAPPDSSNGSAPDYWSSASASNESLADVSTPFQFDDTVLTFLQDSEWETVRSNRTANTGGGVSLSSQFQALSVNGSNTDTLLEFEYAYEGGAGNGGAVRSQSWHTRSTGAASTNTGTNGNRYGCPSATSNAGTAHTITSSIAERSDVSGEIHPDGWARIPAYRAPQEGTRDIVVSRKVRSTDAKLTSS